MSPTSSVSSPAGLFIEATFSSGRRPYTLRAFLLDHQPKGSPPLVAVLLEQVKPTRLDLRKAQVRVGFSPREIEAIHALQKGMTDKEIASAMGISTETAKGYLKTIRAKLGVSTRTAILQKVLSL